MLIPELVYVHSVESLTEDSFNLVLGDGKSEIFRSFLPGQFNMIYLLGFGEMALSISGDPTKQEGLRHTVRAVGKATLSLQHLQPGESVGVRGPFGAGWPVDPFDGDLLILAGGLGIAPLRPILELAAGNPRFSRKTTLLYGSRSPKEILYREDLKRWQEKGITVALTVDRGDESWKGPVGVVTALIGDHLVHPHSTRILVCGPEIMMRFAVKELLKHPVDLNQIYLSMERNMQCAVGFCGHCQYGPHFVCKDGPVFSYPKIEKLFFVDEI